MKLETVISKLKESKIPFYITGSYAVELYTGLRVPSDVDFVVRKEDFEKIESTFKYVNRARKNIKGMKFTTLQFNEYEFGVFDNFKHGATFELNMDRYDRCNKKKIGKFFCPVIPVEDLIELKLVLNRNGGSKADSEDIKLLLRTKEYNLIRLFYMTLKHRTFLRFLKLYRSRYDDGLDRLKAFKKI